MCRERCYYDNEFCQGELWQCESCGEFYCEYHSHVTDKGTNVECVACEYNSADYERDFPNGEPETPQSKESL